MRQKCHCRGLLAALLTLFVVEGHAERLTERCNTNYGNGEVILVGPFGLGMFVKDLVNDPNRDADLYRRLWSPRGTRESNDGVVLLYERVQDTAEIVASLKGDPRVRDLNAWGIYANGEGVCFAALPPATPMTVTEYFNRNLGHYFLSSTEFENGQIDSGAAGPGWERTGESFRTIAPGYCYDSRPVFRFYGPRQNSHFFTVDTLECGTVRRNDPGWGYEGEAFGAREPVGGACPPRTTPVYRAYNGRWRDNDSNHRFTVRRELYDQMVARGWIGEGVAFCAIPPSS